MGAWDVPALIFKWDLEMYLPTFLFRINSIFTCLM